MTAVVYRAAELTDLSQVVEAYEWLFAPPGARPPQWDGATAAGRLARLTTADRGAVLVAEVDGQVVGFCTIYLDIESVRFGQRAWIEDLAVHPDRRSSGIGKGLMDSAMRWARRRGATHVELDSSEARTDAHRFYDREAPTWRSICFGWLF